MDYRTITCKASKQYKLIHSSKIRVCSDGLLRDTDDYIGVALGKAYGKVGDRLILTLSTKKTINVIIVDTKATSDTVNDANQKYDSSMVEFVVDSSKLSKKVKLTGNMSSIKKYKGNVVKVEKVVK